MSFSEILSIVSPIATLLLSGIAYYYKKDIDSSQAIIKSLSSGMEELKAMMRVHGTNYTHLLSTVQQMNIDLRETEKDLTKLDRDFTEKMHQMSIEIERLKKKA